LALGFLDDLGDGGGVLASVAIGLLDAAYGLVSSLLYAGLAASAYRRLGPPTGERRRR
jgi:hypothetical protein